MGTYTVYLRKCTGTVLGWEGQITSVPLRVVEGSVAGVGYSTIIGTTGSSLLNNKKISKTVRGTTNEQLLHRYGALNKYRANGTGVAGKCSLPYGCIVRAIKPV